MCPFCGSTELRALPLPGEDRSEGKSLSLKGRELVFNGKKYTIGKTLGSGGFGLILEVSEAGGNEAMAMKVPLTIGRYFGKGSDFSRREIESSERSIRDEIRAIRKLRTERVIRVWGTGRARCCGPELSSAFPAILMELALCTLKDIILLESSGSIEISLAEKLKMTSRIIRMIGDMHDAGIIHRDIALENIFVVDRDGLIDYVIADFGTSRDRIKNGSDKTTGIVGRDKYLDPLRFDKRYRRDPRVDIFTAGIVITEIFIGNLWDNIIYEPLYELDFEREFLENYASGHIDRHLVRFISGAIKSDISKRYKNAAGMKHQFDRTVSKIVRSIGEKKITKCVDLIYNIPVPLSFIGPGEEKVINYESHSRINLEAGGTTRLKFSTGEICSARIRNAPFFNAFFEKGSVTIVPDMKRLRRVFKIFEKKRFRQDRGIFYFSGQLKIEIKYGRLNAVKRGIHE